MKLSRISFALVICALFGMTGCGNFPQTIPDTTSDKPTTTEPTTTEPTWKSIEYQLMNLCRVFRMIQSTIKCLRFF